MPALPASRVRLLYHISLVLAFLLIINFAVAGMLAQMESLAYTDAFYLAMSATTLAGYGNVGATTDAGKWFIAFYQLFASTLLNYLVTVVTLAFLDEHWVVAAASSS